MTVCLCYHLTSFGSSFFVPPNKINFDNLSFDALLESPLLLIVVLSICTLYLLLLIPARRADKNDLAKVTEGLCDCLLVYSETLVPVKLVLVYLGEQVKHWILSTEYTNHC